MKPIYHHEPSEEASFRIAFLGGATVANVFNMFMLAEPKFLIPAGITALVALVIFIKE